MAKLKNLLNEFVNKDDPSFIKYNDENLAKVKKQISEFEADF